MSDEKPRRPFAGRPGGDKPMRRKAAARDALAPAGDRKPPFAARGDKSKFDKPRPDRPRDGRVGGDNPRVVKRASADDARAERPHKKPRVERPEPTPRTSNFEGERIAKIMARAGVCSRRDAEDWIAQGRVAVNGRVLTSPAVNVNDRDKITIDGAPIQERERTRLFLFHKPAGYVTSARDEEGRATVFSLLEERHPDLPRVVSVGRLDINTEGLLLLTNDGGLARTLELPATGWTRRYRVRVHGAIDQARLDELGKGVTVDGVRYAPIEARLERVQGANAWVAIGLTEGKNREIKRVMEHLGLDVTRLIRISFGPFQLGDLAEGAVEEVRLKTLREQLGKSLAALAGVDFSSPVREASATERQEQRQHAEKRSRKHVSVLRKQRDEKGAAGPRARIERGAVADRKGRAIAVERVTPTRPKIEAAAPTRNARRFEAMREESRGPPQEARRVAERAAGKSTACDARDARDHREPRATNDRRPPQARDSRRDAPANAQLERGAGKRDMRPRAAEKPGERKSPDERFSKDGRQNDRGDTRFEKYAAGRSGGSRDQRRASASRKDRPGGFERPRTDSLRSEGGHKTGARKSDRPRSAAAPRPPRKAPPTKGPHKGPSKGPGAPRGAR